MLFKPAYCTFLCDFMCLIIGQMEYLLFPLVSIECGQCTLCPRQTCFVGQKSWLPAPRQRISWKCSLDLQFPLFECTRKILPWGNIKGFPDTSQRSRCTHICCDKNGIYSSGHGPTTLIPLLHNFSVYSRFFYVP